jgi:putative hydrolase of the HAD superfamily
MLPKAILFDMDDTLLRYSVLPELAWKEACEVSTEETKHIKIDELLSQIDTIRDWYWSDPERHRTGRLNLHGARVTIVKMALEKLGCADERIAAKIATSYTNLREASLEFFPNAEDTLRKLVKKKLSWLY